jgi:adenylate cyclase
VAGIDIETSGLLDGLEGGARAERVELISWLLERGFTVEQIRGAVVPTILPARRAIGDDGTYVSAREISQAHGIDLDLVQRLQRAGGLSRVDDPDARVYLRADGDAAGRARDFIDAGLDPEQLVSVVRVLSDGLSRSPRRPKRW